jgi:hypothetical protein
MVSREASREALTDLFRDRPVADLAALTATLQTHSRMSVFRRLSVVGYLSSCSHAGRYYTLQSIPQFDEDGLWRHQGVLFSQHGTLKATVEHLVEVAEDGRTHPEIQARVHLRVQNTLLDLVREERIDREWLGRQCLYVSADAARAAAQVAMRREQGLDAPAGHRPVPPAAVVEVLLEVIHGSRAKLDATAVAARLRARGRGVTLEEVEEILHSYGLVKKTLRSRSQRSRM